MTAISAFSNFYGPVLTNDLIIKHMMRYRSEKAVFRLRGMKRIQPEQIRAKTHSQVKVSSKDASMKSVYKIDEFTVHIFPLNIFEMFLAFYV